MTSKIWVASYAAAFNIDPYQHGYIVYDMDGDENTTVDQFIIRGGPEHVGLSSPISLEIGKLINDSPFDRYLPGQSFSSRNSKLLASGSSADALWTQLLVNAEAMGTYDPAHAAYALNVPYWPLGSDFGGNCDSVLATLLSESGIDFFSNLPLTGGTGPSLGAWQFPKANELFVTGSADQTLHVYSSDDRVVDFGTGNTTLIIEGLQPDRPLTLVADDNTASTDTIMLNGYDPATLLFRRDYNGNLNVYFTGDDWSNPRLVLEGQFASMEPRFNTLLVTYAGNVTSFSLTESFSLLIPQPHGAYTIPIASVFGRSLTDPIVLDLSAGGTGVQLTSLANSNAHFDLANSGFAVHTGWVGATTGLLVKDNNSNGVVDNITELFGSDAVDGFTALQAIDSNHDNKITSADTAFASLKVWTDSNGDGITQAGELQTLAALNITSINLNATTVDQTANGNVIGSVATFTRSNGTTAQVAEAFFDNSRLDSAFTGSYTLNPVVAVLPNLRGYGTLPDLHVAMSIDPTLLTMVETFANNGLSGAADFSAQIKAILYRWAGVDSVAPTSRGAYVDAQHLGVLEKFVGENFVNLYNGGSTPQNPNGHQGTVLEDDWNKLLSAATERLVIQGPLSGLFSTVQFSMNTDSLTGSADFSTAIATIQQAAPTDAVAAAQYWQAIAPSVLSLANDLGLYESVFKSVGDAISASYAQSSAVTLTDDLGNKLSIAGSANDVIVGTNQTNYINGRSGNDTITGGNGVDQLYGGAGDDTITGGFGADAVYGGDGNDTIVVSGTSESDTIINGGAGYDKLQLGSSANTSGTTITNVEELDIVGSSSVTLGSGQLSGFTAIVNTSGANATSEINAATSGGTYDASGATVTGKLRLRGAAGNDIIIGSVNADTIEGNDGNDQLYGGAGDDTITGGFGADAVYGGDGNDTIVVSGTSESDTIINGGAGYDKLQLGSSANTSGTTITNVEELDIVGSSSVTLGSGQLSGFTAIVNTSGANATSEIYAVTSGGTYDASGATVTGKLRLHGSMGNDVLIGGTGSDSIYGDYGNDTITYDAADTVIDGGAGNDTLVLNQSVATTMNLTNTADQVTGGGTTTGFENINGSGSTAALTLTGDGNANIIRGGAAADTISGGAGDDTLSYDALDVSTDGGAGTDTLNLRQTVALTVSLANTADQVVGGGTTINFENVDGTDSTAALTITGDGNANILKGAAAADILTGGLGNDQLYGGAGNDTYNFARGDGADTVFENDATVGNKDVLLFASGVNYDQLWFKQVGNNLEVDVIGTSDKMTIDSWYLSSARQVESIQAGGLELINSNVINLVNAMAGMTPPPAGQTTLTAAQHTALDPVIAANWHAAA